jgi:hypothetical protein
MKFKILKPANPKEKVKAIVFGLILVFLTFMIVSTMFSCTPKDSTPKDSTPKDSTTKVQSTPAPVKQVVVVDKITISGGKRQYFIVSGRNFKFTTRQLTFNINDTIVIEGENVFPKRNPNNRIQI